MYTQVSVSFGQEIAVTPLQMVHAFSAFARDGTMASLRITSARGEASSAPGAQAISPATAQIAREAMRDVMLEGTGRVAQSTKYQLFGKSGTAQLVKPKGRGYYEDRYVSSFIAGAPFNQPRIVVLCIIDDPDRKKAHFGGAVAGPVVRDIVDQTLEYLGVPPELEQTTPAADSRLVATAD
jgi:cell division protein FtsI/penicillin-binding protein 2